MAKTVLLVALIVWLLALAALALLYYRGKLRGRERHDDDEHPPTFSFRSQPLGHGPYRARRQADDE